MAYRFRLQIVQTDCTGEDNFCKNTALGHVTTMPQVRDSLIEPPLPRLHTQVIIESPVKYKSKHQEGLISPDRPPIKRRKTYQFVDLKL